VLSPPRRDSRPPLAVRLVPAKDDAPYDRAVIDRDASWSVDTVGAIDLAPAVGGALSSLNDGIELGRSNDVELDILALSDVENEGWLSSEGTAIRPVRYGPLFFECLEFVLRWFRFEFDGRLLLSPEDTFLKLASFLMRVENGRRRLAVRSTNSSAPPFRPPSIITAGERVLP
jgi:hypothetical protein